MIIRSKAPLRLGLAGGGSDVSPYSDMYGGLILNATINLYAYCTIEETDNDCIQIDAFDADYHASLPLTRELELDGNALLLKGTYNRLMRDYNLPLQAFRITTYNDAPAGSGPDGRGPGHPGLEILPRRPGSAGVRRHHLQPAGLRSGAHSEGNHPGRNGRTPYAGCIRSRNRESVR